MPAVRIEGIGPWQGGGGPPRAVHLRTIDVPRGGELRVGLTSAEAGGR